MLLSTDGADAGAANDLRSCVRISLVVICTRGMPYANLVCFAHQYEHQKQYQHQYQAQCASVLVCLVPVPV